MKNAGTFPKHQLGNVPALLSAKVGLIYKIRKYLHIKIYFLNEKV
jgi:hypothetical protein